MGLNVEVEAGRRHGWRAREIGAIAILGGFGGLAARAERLLAEEGHVHADDDEHSAHNPALPHGAELAEMFPPYSAVSVLNQVRKSAPPHLSFALNRPLRRHGQAVRTLRLAKRSRPSGRCSEISKARSRCSGKATIRASANRAEMMVIAIEALRQSVAHAQPRARGARRARWARVVGAGRGGVVGAAALAGVPAAGGLTPDACRQNGYPRARALGNPR